eukprot:4148260-Prymnesium_polylepis.2
MDMVGRARCRCAHPSLPTPLPPVVESVPHATAPRDASTRPLPKVHPSYKQRIPTVLSLAARHPAPPPDADTDSPINQTSKSL